MESPPCTMLIRLFGTFEARLNDCPMPPLRSVKGLMALAYLALKCGREVNHAELADALWPLSDAAAGNLSKTLLDLRRALGGKQNPYLLAPTRHTICLNLSAVEVDLMAFERACKRSDLTALESAVALYSGPLLEGWSEGWVHGAREDCRRKYVRVLERLWEAARERGAWVSGRDCLRRLAAAKEIEEGAWRALLLALIAAQDYATAAQVVEELRRGLRSLRRMPEQATRSLYQQIPVQERRAVAPPQPAARPSPLPYPLTEFIGREAEIKAIESRLACRLLTLTGSGGVGKTRLAVHVAHRMADGYAEGARFVGLAALTDLSLAAQQVAAELGLREVQGQSALETLLNYLSCRHLLLVLDNCEHLTEACASLAQDLLRRCPNLHILATSRHALQVAGETVWRVASLSVPGLDWTPKEQDGAEELLTYEAARLFVRQSARHRPDFTVNQENASAVATICARLDGIPLALELAAARIACLSAHQIAARLDDQFQLLTGGSQAAPPRHKTLQALIDWSYNLLTEHERILLRRLSVFVGGWTLEAAESIAADDLLEAVKALDLLGSLADKSLILVEYRGEQARYRMLETIRQYASAKLGQSGEEEALRRRHQGFFRRLAEDTEPKLHGTEQTFWLDELESEHGNLRAALEESLREGSGAAAGLRLAGALFWFWHLRGYFSEGRRWLAKVLSHCPTRQNASERARALQGAGQLAYYQRDYASGRALLEESATLWRAIGDKRGLAYSHIYLCAAINALGDGPAARGVISEGAALAREAGDPWTLGMALWMQGTQTLARGDAVTARPLLEESAALLRDAGDQWALIAPLLYLTTIAREQEDYGRARVLLGEALRLSRKTGDRLRLSGALDLFAHLALWQAHKTPDGELFSRAARLFGAAEVLREAHASAMPFVVRQRYDCDVAAARSALGNEAFEALWAKGNAMTLEQAMECALTL